MHKEKKSGRRGLRELENLLTNKHSPIRKLTLNHKEVVRKCLHLVLSLALLLPFLLNYFKIKLDATIFYSVLSILVLTINAIQIKRPLLRNEAKKFMRDRRKRFFNDIKNFIPLRSQVTSQALDRIEERIREIEDLIDSQLSIIERDYEKRGGYIGLTYGIIGVTISYFLFKDYVLYGIIVLATTDFIATLVGGFTGMHKLPLVNKTVEGSVSGFLVFFAVLIILKVSPVISIVLSIVAAIIEAYAIEDNLLLPISVSFLSSLII